MRPITPNEAIKALPDEVIEAFNDLICENIDGKTAKITQNQAVDRITAKLEIPRDAVFKRGYLDIEDIYRKAGWKVDYDKPGYNETYEGFFTFTKK